MATYVLPQVLVYQDFTSTPSAVANPLRAHIAGGHAYLVRYAEEDEREFGYLDYYDNVVETAYLWPSRPTGGIVDYSYVKLWIKDALLMYFDDAASAGHTITKTAGYNNRIRAASCNFKENGVYARDSLFLDRDVAVGDVVKLQVIDSGSPLTIWTYVKDIIGDEVAAVIGAATADAANGTDSADATATFSDGPLNCVDLTPNGAAYDGITSGHLTETYTVKVLESSVNGDWSTAVLRVLSASGEDDVDSVSPDAGGLMDIGARGLVGTFAVNGTAAESQSAENEDVDPDNLVTGQEWTVVVSQAWSATTATTDPASTYDDANDTTYIIEVTRGGLYTATLPPQIRVTTNNGRDMSGPTSVTAAATVVDVGTQGVGISFNGTGLCKGDRWSIAVTGVAEGPMCNLVLGNNIPTTVLSGSEVGLSLYIRKTLLEVTENRTESPPIVNYSMTETEITVADGVTAYDTSWTDEGVAQPLPVYSAEAKNYGKMYVEYRAWISDLAAEVNGIDDVSDLDTLISGALTPDNPLKWGVSKALENSNGVEVKFTSVADPDDSDSWVAVLDLIAGRDDVYGLVPLTRDRTVLDLYAAHVDAMSTPEQGLWRVAWFALEGIAEIPIVSAGSTVPGYLDATTTDGEVCECVIVDDPETTGTQYTIVRCDAGNGEFVTNQVHAGDIVRALYGGDGFGTETYEEYVVDEVQSEDQLRLVAGPAAAVNVASKIEIWRNLTATQEAAAIAVDAGSWNNRRIRAVWPDTIESSGTTQEGYHLCAALAGLSSGVVPQQGLTNVAIAGFSDVARTIRKFSRTQLDAMAVAGVWIVTQNLYDGEVYTRHGLTTGDYEDLNAREEMVTRNVDSISYRFKDNLAPFIGVSNVTPTMEALLRHSIETLITVLKNEKSTTQLGGQLVTAEIASLAQHPTLLDRYVVIINAVIPYPFNNCELHLVI